MKELEEIKRLSIEDLEHIRGWLRACYLRCQSSGDVKSMEQLTKLGYKINNIILRMKLFPNYEQLKIDN